MITITDMFYIDTRLVKLNGTKNVFKSLNYGDKDYIYIYKDTKGKCVAVWDLAVKQPDIDYEQVTISRLNNLDFDYNVNNMFATFTYNLFGDEYWKPEYKLAVFQFTSMEMKSQEFTRYCKNVILPMDRYIYSKMICPIQSTLLTTDLSGKAIGTTLVNMGNAQVDAQRYCMIGFTVFDIFTETMFVDVFDFIDRVRDINSESAVLIETTTDERIKSSYSYYLKERFNLK